MNDLVLSIMLVKEFMFQTFKRHRINICSVFKLHKQYECKISREKSQEGIQLYCLSLRIMIAFVILKVR